MARRPLAPLVPLLLLLLLAAAADVDLSGIKGGVLYKNGAQTSCELGVLDSRAAMVSADCLDFSGGYVDMRTKYTVFLDAGIDGKSAVYPVTAIGVHPQYHTTNKANNIAVLQYNKKGKQNFTNTLAVGRTAWKTLIYARRAPLNATAHTWGDTVIAEVANKTDGTCASMLPLFKANQQAFVCGAPLAGAAAAGLQMPTPCRKLPYGTVYTRINGTLYPAGIFSHAAIKGGADLCSANATTRSYFTAFSDYITFANITLKREISYAAPGKGIAPQDSPYYTMNRPAGKPPKDVTVQGGNLLAPKAATSSAPETPSPTMPSPPKATATTTAQSSDSDGDSDGDSGDGSSHGGKPTRTIIIIVAVCVSVGVSLATAAGFFVVRWYRGHVKRTRDPYRENATRHMLIHDLGGASLPEKDARTTHHPSPASTVATRDPPPGYLYTPLE
ncbi:hypothetical protein H4R18_002783 [Coemansia javaensis]|uniref:Uncharacterized protein n=1 Tax=Coemansia javaensis TaxID=2761396 RepID=A0A9W8HE33_9FUNG|nr:hypothetical protein H4R18_002783 [Coemansia javaensis]